jgi:hypothetical protein
MANCPQEPGYRTVVLLESVLCIPLLTQVQKALRTRLLVDDCHGKEQALNSQPSTNWLTAGNAVTCPWQ